MHWYRAYHGAPFDTKLALVAKRANVTRGHAASVWWAVLDFASQSNPRGSVAGIDPEEIAAAFDYDEADVARVLDAMRLKHLMIGEQEELTGWDKRQVQREDDTAAERKRKQRERDTEQSSRDVTQCHAPEKSREEKIREEPPSPSGTTPHGAQHDGSPSRGSRLPNDWEPGLDDREFARQLGLDPTAVAERFRDFWCAKPGAAGRKTDWQRTWRNWCRRDADERRPAGKGAGVDGPGAGGVMGAALRVIARRQGAAGL